jgi:hypothetical protein
MSQSKQFHMGNIKAWYDKKSSEYIPYSEMSKDQLQKCLHIAQKRELQLIQQQHVFTRLIEDIDEECAKRSIELADVPNDYYKNNRVLKEKITKSKSLDA